ncbi:pectinesterase inhibitor-like [Camellia sinensis]|uniref:pectinesterase inhibitor-like n=1 Tax=Camellia sinensis TaxID=4442 RepID=UPI001036D63F|nr:pectinesterase inhibitor-like [Camellia sinensis]
MTRIVLLFVLFSLNYHSHVDLIADTCKKSENPDLCNSTLRSDPRSAKADAKGLARIMIEAALTKASTTFNQVKKLLSKTTEPVLKGCLTICTDYLLVYNLLTWDKQKSLQLRKAEESNWNLTLKSAIFHHSASSKLKQYVYHSWEYIDEITKDGNTISKDVSWEIKKMLCNLE